MNQKIVIFIVALSFFLTGCQSNNTSEDTANNTSMNSSEVTLSLEKTEFGRGAQSDGADTNAKNEPTRILTDDATSIIIYFSRSGNSENLARMIHNENNADMLELSVANPYPSDYDATVERADKERDNQDYPEISTDIPDFSQYDTIYLGYQTWSMTLSNPIISFLMDQGSNLSQKTIYPFSTNAGYGEGDSLTRIAELTPGADIALSFNIEDSDLLSNQDQVVEWLNNN